MPGTVHPGVKLYNVDGSVVLSATGEVSAPGGGIAGSLYGEAHLEVDVVIAATSPATPPNTFPAGQPAVLLSVGPVTTDGGPVLVRASTSVFIVNTDNVAEEEPFVQLQLWMDGAPLPNANATLAYSWNGGSPTPIEAIEAFGGIERLFHGAQAIPAGAHTFELRWGVQGTAPGVSAGIFAADGSFDHASLIVRRETFVT